MEQHGKLLESTECVQIPAPILSYRIVGRHSASLSLSFHMGKMAEKYLLPRTSLLLVRIKYDKGGKKEAKRKQIISKDTFKNISWGQVQWFMPIILAPW